jgi:lysozyme
MDSLFGQLKRDEGFYDTAYPDPITHAEPWTIGVGHTGPEVHKGLVWTDAQVLQALENDINTHDRALFLNAPWAATLDDARKGVLRNMCFNMGWPRLSAFHKFLAAMQSGHWATASAEMENSEWFHQVGLRALRLQKQVILGEWQ